MSYTCSILLIFSILIENAISLQEISQEFRKVFVIEYNNVRGRYARGEMQKFPSVPNMMEASWSKSATESAEYVINQLCTSSNYTKINDYYIILVSSRKYKRDDIRVWAESFYRDPERNSAKNIELTIRPEVIEIGCAFSLCGRISYAVCAHGKINCSSNCTAFDKGETCSKCPIGAKCTIDGLCSTRKNLSSTVSKISTDLQSTFITYLNIARTRVSTGSLGFGYEENGEYKELQFPEAAKMMEVNWSDSAAIVAENAIMDYCINGSEILYNLGKYHLAAAEYFDLWGPEEIPFRFFQMDQEWPLLLTEKFSESEEYTTFFSFSRKSVLTARGEITEVGCSYEYCRENAVAVCAFGEITCTSNCTIYEKGNTCSNCPKGSKCTFDGLCSFREEATTKFTKISKKDQTRLLEKINEVRSTIAIGEQEVFTKMTGQSVKEKLPSATFMMEIEWTEFCVDVAEIKLSEWCKDGISFQLDDDIKASAWSKPVSFNDSSRKSKNWDIRPKDYFSFSYNEIPIVLTADDLRGDRLSDIFRFDRFDILMAWATVNEIGCAMEYCRGEVVLMCVMAPFGNCTDNCPVYPKGPACTECPDETECLDVGLCRKKVWRQDVDDKEEEEFIAETLKGSNSNFLSLTSFCLIFMVLVVGRDLNF